MDSSRGNNASTDEAAARHAAMVVSAASFQGSMGTGTGTGTGTGGATEPGGGGGGGDGDSQLEESVDERQIREGVHADSTEVHEVMILLIFFSQFLQYMCSAVIIHPLVMWTQRRQTPGRRWDRI